MPADARALSTHNEIPVRAWVRLGVKILIAVLMLLMFMSAEAPIPLYQGF